MTPPTAPPAPADDLVEWLNEMRIYEENSEETTEAFTRTIARIRADAETIRGLRQLEIDDANRHGSITWVKEHILSFMPELNASSLEYMVSAVIGRAERAEAETIRALWEEKARLYVSLELMCRTAERAESERDALKKELKWRVELSEGYYVEAAKGWVKFRAAEAELRNIANADPSKWDADMRDQFQQWAQNRARAVLNGAKP